MTAPLYLHLHHKCKYAGSQRSDTPPPDGALCAVAHNGSTDGRCPHWSAWTHTSSTSLSASVMRLSSRRCVITRAHHGRTPRASAGWTVAG